MQRDMHRISIPAPAESPPEGAGFPVVVAAARLVRQALTDAGAFRRWTWFASWV